MQQPTIELICTKCGVKHYKWPYEIKKINLPFVCKKCKRLGDEKIICQFCKKEFVAKIREERKFCSKSCSASFSNIDRVISDGQKEKISVHLKAYYKANPDKPRTRRALCNNKCKIHYYNCKNCNKVFIRANAKGNLSKLTCSKECAIYLSVGNRKYQNGSRKPVYYFNKNENKEVLLDSSWEVKTAEHLDKLNIKWIRPKFLKWVDDKNKTRYYFPDFYLVDYDLYLDPKNPYCMNRDIAKMKYFENKIHIVYGDIEKILSVIDNIVR